MDDAARARAATREAIADVAPAPLRELLDERLRDAAMAPGVLTRLSARAANGEPEAEGLDRRAAGVQLIYDGLRLTRTLARAPPWEDGDRDRADLEIVAADVLVARGFFLLARTEAARKAVETVRAFGRDETNRAGGRSGPDLDGRTLEADVFELAIVAGTSITGAEPPADARPFAVDLARSFDRESPSVPELLSEPAVEALVGLVAEHERPPASPDRIWAGSSATDP